MKLLLARALVLEANLMDAVSENKADPSQRERSRRSRFRAARLAHWPIYDRLAQQVVNVRKRALRSARLH